MLEHKKIARHYIFSTKKVVLLFFMVISINNNAFSAVVACVANGRLYYNKIGTYPSWNPSFPFQVFNRSNAASSSFPLNYDPGSPSCQVNAANITYDYTTTPNGCLVNTSLTTTGADYGAQVTSYTTNNAGSCNVPLDDYIPFLILTTIGLCFYFFQKGKFGA